MFTERLLAKVIVLSVGAERTIGLWIRRFVCDEFTHGLKRSLRGNSGIAPRFGAFFGRLNGIVKLLVFFTLAPFTPYE